MKRLESNFTNMVLSLTLVTVVAAALLGGLYILTEEPIAVQKQQKQQSAITSVLPAIEGLSIAEPEQKDGMKLYKGYTDGQWVCTAVETAENGFGGVFKVMVGFDRQGNVTGYEVLEHQETPGLGDHMTDWFKTAKNNQSILGSNPVARKFEVSKDGGDIDAITAATISSRAFLKAVRNAYNAMAESPVEAVSGASIQQQPVASEETDTIVEPENTDNHE